MPHRHGQAFKSVRVARMQERLNEAPPALLQPADVSTAPEGPAWFDIQAWKGRPLAPDWEASMVNPSQQQSLRGSKALEAYTDGIRPYLGRTGPMGIVMQPRFGRHRCTRPAMCLYTARECGALG